jgi:hypothetical protein
VYRRTVWNGVSRPRPDDRLQNLNHRSRRPQRCSLRNQAALPGDRFMVSISLVRMKRFLRVLVRNSRSNDSVVSGAGRYVFGSRSKTWAFSNSQDMTIQSNLLGRRPTHRSVACSRRIENVPATYRSQREMRRRAAMAPVGCGVIWRQARASVES